MHAYLWQKLCEEVVERGGKGEGGVRRHRTVSKIETELPQCHHISTTVHRGEQV